MKKSAKKASPPKPPPLTAAVIDRIVHHASVFKTEGDSYRLQAAKKSPLRRRTTAKRA